MTKQKANHVIPGMNDAKAQGSGAGYNEGNSKRSFTTMEKQYNKKKKKNQ